MGIRIVYIFFVTLFALSVSNVLAECNLEVSFIKGSNEEGQKDSFSDETFNQLKHLPFNSFKLLNKEISKIKLGNEINFKFYDSKHKVSFMPTNLTSNKVQAMLKWVENTDTNLINTKMWFEKNKNIVFGSQTGEKCKIINVNISCNN